MMSFPLGAVVGDIVDYFNFDFNTTFFPVIFHGLTEGDGYHVAVGESKINAAGHGFQIVFTLWRVNVGGG